MAETVRLETDEILRLLFSEPNLEHWMTSEASGVSFPSFSEYITALCTRRGEPSERVINRANIEKSYGHHLFTGRRNPSRDTVLLLAFGFELDYAGTQELLKAARKSALYPRIKRDAAIIYCLHNHVSLMDTQIILQDLELPLLGGREK